MSRPRDLSRRGLVVWVLAWTVILGAFVALGGSGCGYAERRWFPQVYVGQPCPEPEREVLEAKGLMRTRCADGRTILEGWPPLRP